MTSDPIPFPMPKVVVNQHVPEGVMLPVSQQAADRLDELARAISEAEASQLATTEVLRPGAVPADDASPFPDEPELPPAERTPTEHTVKVVRCTKCKAAIETTIVTADNPQLCAGCFSLLLNGVGTVAALPGEEERPTRLTFQLRSPPAAVLEHQRHLPDSIENAIGQAAKEFGAELREAFFAGDGNVFKLLAQAKVHGLLLMVVVQPAMLPPSALKKGVKVDLRRKDKP